MIDMINMIEFYLMIEASLVNVNDIIYFIPYNSHFTLL